MPNRPLNELSSNKKCYHSILLVYSRMLCYLMNQSQLCLLLQDLSCIYLQKLHSNIELNLRQDQYCLELLTPELILLLQCLVKVYQFPVSKVQNRWKDLLPYGILQCLIFHPHPGHLYHPGLRFQSFPFPSHHSFHRRLYRQMD